MRFPRTIPGAAALAVLLPLLLTPPASQAADPGSPGLLPVCPEEAAKLQRGTRPKRALYDPTQAIDVSSDSARLDVGGDAQATGQVVVKQGDQKITADQVHIDTATNGVDVIGNVHYLDPEMSVTGTTGHYEGGAGQFAGADFQMLQQPARGHANGIRLEKSGAIDLTDVFYTTCPPERVDWHIDADSVQINPSHQTGVAHNARIRFEDLTLLYLPWLSFPTSSDRQSGFLFPSIGSSSRGGLQLSVPYYLNLAPNYDATLEPTYYSRRGLDMDTEFRFLTDNSKGTLDVNVLPHDAEADRSRSRLRLEDVTLLPGDWRLRINAQNVSDNTYFEDFAQGADSTSITFLPRVLELSYRDDVWRSGAILSNYQTLDSELATTDRPYTEVPRLYASGWWRNALYTPLEYGFDSEAVDFQRETGVQGWRFDLMPHAQLRYEGAGYFLQPSLAFRATQYRLTDTTGEAETSPSRTLPVASVDTGLVFERAVGSDGGRTLTLEPRLMYLYVPYRRQDALPVFDTGLPDLNWVELFRTNRYVGTDRIGDANQVSTGITSRLFATESGTRYLSATIGETFYFTQPKVLLPDELPTNRTSSDLTAQAELKAFEHWSVDLGLQWNPHDNQAEKSEVRVQYQPEGMKVVNLGYLYDRSQQAEQADVSAAWPVTHSWNLYARMLYSLQNRSAIDEFAGFEYNSCCWGIRAVVRNYVADHTGKRDTGIFLQLELKGLSSVGKAANAFLEQAIRGYSPATDKR